MAFINGFLGLCAAVGTGTATELTTAAYQRQPIAFARPINGRSPSSRAFSFGALGSPSPSGNTAGLIAGKAIYDSPTGGNLLLVLPYPSPRPFAASGPTSQHEPGHMHLEFTALAAYPDGDAFTGNLLAATALGAFWEEPGYIATRTILSAGVPLRIVRGVLAAA